MARVSSWRGRVRVARRASGVARCARSARVRPRADSRVVAFSGRSRPASQAMSPVITSSPGGTRRSLLVPSHPRRSLTDMRGWLGLCRQRRRKESSSSRQPRTATPVLSEKGSWRCGSSRRDQPGAASNRTCCCPAPARGRREMLYRRNESVVTAEPSSHYVGSRALVGTRGRLVKTGARGVPWAAVWDFPPGARHLRVAVRRGAPGGYVVVSNSRRDRVGADARCRRFLARTAWS